MGSRDKRYAFSFIGLLLLIGPMISFARDYYVAPDGSDTGQGTKGDPFMTIQKAMALAKPGDSCSIAPGIYRETVTPSQSGTEENPIRLRAAVKDSVTIAGMDPVGGWTKHTGRIYKAPMDWSLGKNNQVFFDGSPLQEARWPNDRDGDPLTPDGMDIGGGDVDHILCSQFPGDWQAEDLKGAVVWAIAGSAWSSWTSTVFDYDPASGSLSFPSFKGNWWVETRHNPKSKMGRFYLVGALKLLDAPGEWFYDEAMKELYLWAPEGVDPSQHRVDAKSRRLGLDLQGRSWITVEGLNLRGCTLDLDKASHCRVLNAKAHYISQTRGGQTVSGINEKSGVTISGHHNRLLNCEIAYSAGNGVSLGGEDNAVVNCWIHHIDTIGAYCAPVTMSGRRHLVSHNTLAYTGRDGLKPGGSEHLIQYNDIGFVGRICHDLGIIYTAGNDGGNTRFCYNYCHDNPGSRSNVGIYLDNYTKNFIVHHNVVWNVGNGIRLNRPTGFCMVLNNTVLADITNNWGPWKGQKVQWGCHVMNNLSTGKVIMNPEVVTHANVSELSLPQILSWTLANLENEKGIAIAGITPPENVEVGAYQDKVSSWHAGHDFNRVPDVTYTPATEPMRNCVRNSAFEQLRVSRGDGKSTPLAYWTAIGQGTAVVKHFGGFNTPPANARNSVHGNSLTLGGDADDGIEQQVTGLEPNTPYYFSGYAKHLADVNVEFSVQVPNGTMVRKSSRDVGLGEGQTWRFVQGQFKTGPNDTEAVFRILKRTDGLAYIDDTGIVIAQY